MKILLYFTVVCILFSCSNDKNFEYDMPLTKGRTACISNEDIRVENGYLVVKDFDVLDSLEQTCIEMSENERIEWERKIGFESAYSHFKSYFDDFDDLEDDEQMKAFQKQYQGVLKIIDENGCLDVDYPFNVHGKAEILSKDGKIKIGNTLWIYKNNRKITIKNASKDRMEAFADAVNSDAENGVIVDYYNTPITRSGQADGFMTLTGGDQYKDNRRYKWALDFYPEKADHEERTVLALYQQGYKRRNSKKSWRTYRTRYTVRRLISYELGGFSVPITSSEDRGGRYFKIAMVRNGKFPSFHVEIDHESRGYTAPKLKYDYNGVSGSAIESIMKY